MKSPFLSTFVAFLKDRKFHKHLAIAIASIAVLLFILFQSLAVYTRHGESVTVPNLKGMTLQQAQELLADKNFSFEVDSVYSVDKAPGTILEQDPDVDTKVKEGRTIYVSIVSMIAPKVKIPDLVDVSLREATAIIESYGLKVGNLIYKPDLAQNAVLGIIYGGKNVSAGYSLAKGSTIDLIVGDGYGSTVLTVPNLVGNSLEEAMFVIQASSLNAGTIHYDETVKDSTQISKIYVYKQLPAFSDSSKINQGEPIDLFITRDRSKIN